MNPGASLERSQKKQGASGIVVRNETVDALRGAAALSVCFFHFTNGQQHFSEVSYMRPAGALGWVGVEVFFVISGFVVPYSMARANYALALWPTFMLKRLIRLEPPYLVSIVMVVLLALASSVAPDFRGPPIDWTFCQMAGHLVYLNALVGMSWLNPVYWSLAIEFQYYMLLGLALPAFCAGSAVTRISLLAAVAALPLLTPSTEGWLLVSYLPTFAAGILTFLLVQGLIRRWMYWGTLTVLAVYLSATRGELVTVAVIATAAIIATVRLPRIAPVAWLGAISYSVYLLHVPIGGRVMNLASRLPAMPAIEVAAVAIAFAGTIVAAHGLHVLVERPARDLAASVRYKN